jgi:benzoyl-CoA reductase/2-hydroxyglutaryl-CoA dehydratase subunit BcrC/BadD/HgdB
MTNEVRNSSEEIPALADLRSAYRHRLRHAQAWSERGGKVIGSLGNTVPSEYVLACDAFPLVVTPEIGRATPLADEFIATESWRARSIVERALEGSLAFIDLLVPTRGTEWLYYALKEMVRQGMGEKVPPLHMHDYVLTVSQPAFNYNRGRNAALREALERHYGPIRPEKLRAAIALVNQRSVLYDEVQRLRDSRAIGGVEAMEILGAGYFMHPSEYVRLLREVVEFRKRVGAHATGAMTLLLPGEELENLELHAALSEAGAHVVAEDTWWGARSTAPQIETSGDPFAAVDRKGHAAMSGINVSPRAVRQQWLLRQMERPDLEAVIFYIPPKDTIFGWDYPKLKAHAESRGLRTLLIRSNLDTDVGRAEMQALTTNFFAHRSADTVNNNTTKRDS